MKTKLSKWTTLLVFVGLMITSGVTLTAQTPTQSEPITAHWMAVTAHQVTPQKITLTASRGGEAITGGDYNESHPSIAANPSGELFAAYEGTTDGSAYYPIFADSADWTSGLYFQEAAGCMYPQVDYKTGGFYGTFQPSPDTSGQIWIVDATDPTNPSGAYWDFSSFNFNTFQDFKLGTYVHAGPTDDGAWNWGGLAFEGYNGYNGASVVGCPFVFYQEDSAGQGIIGWLQGQVSGCVHTANDIDLIKNMSYSVYDRNGGTYSELLVRKDDFGKWTNAGSYYTHPMVTTKKVNDAAGNVQNPDIVANNNTVLLVAQDDNGGTQNVFCYRSTNGFSSFTAIQVTNSGDCLYPKIALIGNTAVCTYVKDGQVYYKASTDAGVTWGAETLANTDDQVVTEYGCTDIAAAGTHVYDVWQDSSGANRDIWYNDFYQPTAPVIEIGTITGSIGKVTAEVKNTGTGAATNVAWTLTVKGGILGKINKVNSGTIDSLAPQTTVPVSVTGIFGLGAITAKATAGTASKTETGKVILIFVKI